MAQEPAAMRRPHGRFGTIVTALAAGFAGGLLAPLVLPRLERNVRPASKRLFKTGIALYERGRERAAEVGELASDVMTEARAEYEAEQQPRPNGEGNSVAAKEIVRPHNGHGEEVGAPNA
jgi:Protein of unknown function (DUF5132)